MKKRVGVSRLVVLLGFIFLGAFVLVLYNNDLRNIISTYQAPSTGVLTSNTVYQSDTLILSATFNVIEREIQSSTAYLDLDTGEIGNSVTSDIQFDFGGGSDVFYALIPINGAVNKRVGEVTPGYEGCQSLLNSFTEGAAEALENEYMCVLTNQGRLAQVRVDEILPYEIELRDIGRIQISFIVWHTMNGK